MIRTEIDSGVDREIDSGLDREIDSGVDRDRQWCGQR